ncbi:RNase H-like domain found in reverse transcriptase [Popillia japonica]|uniref:RNase H-like domain found in reverse transcriptase n=1 Tax=Popillia japonica TaxID=7064 RepID=A0AAW1HS71_POPJA
MIELTLQEEEERNPVDRPKSGYIKLSKVRLQECGEFRPVFDFSKRTIPCESKYHRFELHAIKRFHVYLFGKPFKIVRDCDNHRFELHAIRRFHVYLFGKPFRIVTDCDSFRLTLAKKDINPRIARWAMMLQDYDYTVVHRPGKRN